MKAKNTFLALLVVGLLAIAGIFLNTQAQESPAQVTMAQRFVKSGPQALGAGVLQVGSIGTLSPAVASATRTEVVAAPASGSIWLQSVIIEKATATTGLVTVSYGTGTNCGTGTTVLLTLGPQTSTSLLPIGTYSLQVQVPAAKALCLTTDAATTSARVVAQ